jgi:hypothetical protein
MPKTLIDQGRNKYREWQSGLTIHSSSVSNQTGMHLGKAFKTLVLPKYSALHGKKGMGGNKEKKDYTIPWDSNLADQIEKLIIDEVYSHKSNYPQETEIEKYETELKIQIAANRIAEILAAGPHSTYSYFRDHTKVSYEVGTILSIGNGNLGTPFIDNFLRANALRSIFKNSEIPQPDKHFERNAKLVFRNIRSLDRASLEERYEELYQKHTLQLSAGGGASLSNEERVEVMQKNPEQQFKASDFINLDNMSQYILGYVYSFSNRLRVDSVKRSKQNEVAVESVSREGVRSFMKTRIFPDINDLIDLFPQCQADKKSRAVQGFFSEEDEKTKEEASNLHSSLLGRNAEKNETLAFKIKPTLDSASVKQTKNNPVSRLISGKTNSQIHF